MKLVALYCLVLLGLAIYSYSQIDLNLTLFQNPLFLQFQNWAIQLGYFQRSESVAVFLIFIFLLTVFNVWFVRLAQQDKLPIKNLWVVLLAVSIFGLISYPAFSHDIFNYIFDARLVLYHHVNPYTSTALMFPGDDWTRFMNWTHRTYPYGPAWLVISLPFYLAGFGKFVLTLMSFKALSGIAYVGICYLLLKLSGKVSAIFFATNPIILIEAVNSSHLDIVMLAFAILAYYFLTARKVLFSALSLVVSIGVKYASGLFIPVFYWPKIKDATRVRLLALLSLVGAFLQTYNREFLPHYLILFLGFASLDNNKKLFLVTAMGSAFLLVVRYFPFLSTGAWSPMRIF